MGTLRRSSVRSLSVWPGVELSSTGVIALSVAVVSTAYGVFQCMRRPHDPTRSLERDYQRSLDAAAQRRVKLHFHEESFVHREAYTAAIKRFVERNVAERPGYMIVGGVRGCGKSTVVLDALRDLDGVHVARFGSESDTKAMFNTLLSPSGSFTVSTEKEVYEFVTAVQRKHHPHHASWRPVLVAEVDSELAVVEVSKALKRIGCDLAAAHVILVLGDENEAFVLPDDPARQTWLWVEDLTEAEAHELLDRQGFFVRAGPADNDANAALRARLFHNVGTRAAMLLAVLGVAQISSQPAYDAGIVDRFIAARLSDASMTVRSLCTLPADGTKADGRAFTRLLEELLRTDVGTGVCTHHTCDYLADPMTAAARFKQNGFHAVQFHPPTVTYRFHSVAHRRAAEALFAERLLK